MNGGARDEFAVNVASSPNMPPMILEATRVIVAVSLSRRMRGQCRRHAFRAQRALPPILCGACDAGFFWRPTWIMNGFRGGEAMSESEAARRKIPERLRGLTKYADKQSIVYQEHANRHSWRAMLN